MRACDLIERLRSRTVPNWGHATGGTPRMYGHKPDELCQKAADKIEELLRWKGTNAPRLEALQGLLHAAQHEAHAGREAIATLDSERAANALLTEEVESLRAANEAFGRRQKWWNSKMFDAEQEIERLRAAAEKARAALSDLLMTRDPVVYSAALAALDAVLGSNYQHKRALPERG